MGGTYGRDVTNKLYITSTSQRTILDSELANEDYYGQLACFSGASTNTAKCGTIISTDYTTWVNSYRFTRLRVIDEPTISGDSGAPVYLSNTVKGIIKGHTGSGNGMYSHVEYVLRDLGLDFVMTWN